MTSCGSCDNCLRDPESIINKDVTLDAWKIVKVVAELENTGGRATLASVSDLVRGLGKGGYTVLAGSNSKKRKPDPEKATMDIEKLVGSKVALNKDVGVIPPAFLIHRTLNRF